MPDIKINKNDSFGYIKYDYLFRQVILPLFLQSLKKHRLNTDLNTEPININLRESQILTRGDVRFIIKYDYQEDTFPSPDDSETDIGVKLFNTVRDSIIIDEEKNFQLPNYDRG